MTPEAALEAPEATDEAPDATELVASAALEATEEAMDEAIEDMDMVDEGIMLEAIEEAPPAADPPRVAAKVPSSRPARADTSCMPSAWLLAQKLV